MNLLEETVVEYGMQELDGSDGAFRVLLEVWVHTLDAKLQGVVYPRRPDGVEQIRRPVSYS